jgi:methionyl-tRNA formyltransferase
MHSRAERRHKSIYAHVASKYFLNKNKRFFVEKLKIIFAGTPDFAAKHLSALIASDRYQIVAVYSQPDRPAGRGKKLMASAVKNIALENNLPIYQPANFKDTSDIEILASLNADIMIVVAYGLILPKNILEIPRLGCLNVHGSLLPRWRGAAPIQRAIWAGDKQTGVTIMQMDEGLDTGNMLSKSICEISETETSASLYDKLAKQAPQALIDTLEKLIAGELTPEVQNDDLANYAKKLNKNEAKIDWNNDADFIARCVRAFNPWPMSTFTLQDQTIKVHQASVIKVKNTEHPVGCILQADKTGIQVQCATDILNLEVIQLAGKKAMPVQAILNSRKEMFAVGIEMNELEKKGQEI